MVLAFTGRLGSGFSHTIAIPVSIIRVIVVAGPAWGQPGTEFPRPSAGWASPADGLFRFGV